MADRCVQTGVTLRLKSPAPARGQPLAVSAELWVDVESDGGRWRHGGQWAFGEFRLGEDPTNPLIDLAFAQRENNLGGLLGDLRREGVDVTRFECYSAPFRVELDAQLRAVLAGTWTERDPC